MTPFPQETILGLLLNLFIYYFITTAPIYNFVDGKTLSAFSKIISELMNIFEKESLVIVVLFQGNKVIVNPDKFQALIINRRRQGHTNRQI